MVVYTIKGDYFDCQLYSGYLFLWTYSGSLKVYNFHRLLKTLEDNHELSERALSRFQIGDLDKIESRFPTDSEVYCGTYYISAKTGLYQSKLNNLEQGFRKVWDCPLLSVSAKPRKGITMAGGEEGVFVFSESEHIKKKYGISESNILRVSNNHANYSDFCYRGLFATSLMDNSYYLDTSRYGLEEGPISVEKIFPGQTISLSWSYRDKIYAYIDEKIYVRRIEFGEKGIEFIPHEEYWFYPQKGKVLSGTSTDYADVIELEHALVILPTHRENTSHAETIWESVTRWRTFPKSYGYNNVVMVILEDEIKIYIIEPINQHNRQDIW